MNASIYLSQDNRNYKIIGVIVSLHQSARIIQVTVCMTRYKLGLNYKFKPFWEHLLTGSRSAA